MVILYSITFILIIGFKLLDFMLCLKTEPHLTPLFHDLKTVVPVPIMMVLNKVFVILA